MSATSKLLRDLGLASKDVESLERYAKNEGLSLREYVSFILRTYSPPQEVGYDD